MRSDEQYVRLRAVRKGKNSVSDVLTLGHDGTVIHAFVMKELLGRRSDDLFTEATRLGVDLYVSA